MPLEFLIRNTSFFIQLTEWSNIVYRPIQYYERCFIFSCRFKIHQPFESDQIHIKKAWLRRTLQEESNWIVDIIKCYTRITE